MAENAPPQAFSCTLAGTLGRLLLNAATCSRLFSAGFSWGRKTDPWATARPKDWAPGEAQGASMGAMDMTFPFFRVRKSRRASEQAPQGRNNRKGEGGWGLAGARVQLEQVARGRRGEGGRVVGQGHALQLALDQCAPRMTADGQRHSRVRRGAGAFLVGYCRDHRERVPALVVAAHKNALAGDVGHLRAGARVRRAFAMGATHPHEAISTRGKTQSTESIGAELRVNQSLGTRNLWSVRGCGVLAAKVGQAAQQHQARERGQRPRLTLGEGLNLSALCGQQADGDGLFGDDASRRAACCLDLGGHCVRYPLCKEEFHCEPKSTAENCVLQ